MQIKRFVALVLSACLCLVPLLGCAEETTLKTDDVLGNGWQRTATLPLTYAQQFQVDFYPDDYALLSLADGSRFLVVPPEAEVPAALDPTIVVLQQPLDNIYLVATSAMCLFDALDALDHIALSGTKANDWYIPHARAAMERGAIRYAGKYSTPDYELILAENTALAIESTMINHTPEVQDKLEELGVPVLVDQSSYEAHPLGRTEWIKLYGVLTGNLDAATERFAEQVAYVERLADLPSTDKTVAFFYVSSTGYAVTRKSGDYVTKMIELAGARSIFENLGDPTTATSTVALEMERFYATAKDADYIIYNSTIGGELDSLESFLAMNELFADFKAVQDGHVYSTSKNLFQETTELGLMIQEMHTIFSEDNPDLTALRFLYRLSP